MQFRYARHTTNLKALQQFYCEVLKLEVIGSFAGHNGYDGLFLGKPGLNWHLEFTQNGDAPLHQADDDDALVFYPETMTEYQQIVDAIQKLGITTLVAKNPYWNENGICVADPDGFGVIISKQRVSR